MIDTLCRLGFQWKVKESSGQKYQLIGSQLVQEGSCASSLFRVICCCGTDWRTRIMRWAERFQPEAQSLIGMNVHSISSLSCDQKKALLYALERLGLQFEIQAELEEPIKLLRDGIEANYSPFQELPEELKHEIFTHVAHFRDALALGCASKEMRSIVDNDDKYWTNQVCQREEVLTSSSVQELKLQCIGHVRSYVEVVLGRFDLKANWEDQVIKANQYLKQCSQTPKLTRIVTRALKKKCSIGVLQQILSCATFPSLDKGTSSDIWKLAAEHPKPLKVLQLLVGQMPEIEQTRESLPLCLRAVVNQTLKLDGIKKTLNKKETFPRIFFEFQKHRWIGSAIKEWFVKYGCPSPMSTQHQRDYFIMIYMIILFNEDVSSLSLAKSCWLIMSYKESFTKTMIQCFYLLGKGNYFLPQWSKSGKAFDIEEFVVDFRDFLDVKVDSDSCIAQEEAITKIEQSNSKDGFVLSENQLQILAEIASIADPEEQAIIKKMKELATGQCEP